MSTSVTDPGGPYARRHDLDALRIAAFGLLILYHVGMVFVTWDFHVKSRHASQAVEPLMLLLNPWRLTLLFIISGAATRFMSEHMTLKALRRSRSARLLVPLLFGMLVVVPPQTWAQVQESAGYAGSFWQFWPIYLTGGRPEWHVIMPTYNHLWFVVYLWLYTMLAVAVWRWLPALERGADRLLAGPGLWIWPIVVPLVMRIALFPVFGETHALIDDVWAHAHYGLAFVLGIAIARNTPVWDRLARSWAWTLGLGLTVYLGWISLRYGPWAMPSGLLRELLWTLGREIFAWLTMAGLFGAARRYISRGSPLLSRLTEAVFPFYIIHQTTIVLVAHALRNAGLGAPVEAAILIISTALSCAAAYGLALALPILRLPMGLKPAPASGRLRSGSLARG